MTIRTAIYTRIWAEEQGKSPGGFDQQRETCQAVAVDKGWLVAAEFGDGRDVALDEKPPGFIQFLEAACEVDVGAVIIPSLASLGVSARLVLRRLDQLNECGVIIVSCEEELDTGTASGRFALKVICSLAALKPDNAAARTSKGRDARGRKDGERGGQLPMGYKRVIDASGNSPGVEIEDTAAETVRYMFVLRSMGNSLLAIAGKLNDLGVATSRDKQWHASSVKVVLDNEDKYLGGRRWQSSYRWPKILEN